MSASYCECEWEGLQVIPLIKSVFEVCTFTHVLPVWMVIFWNVFFFATWLAMHLLYVVILSIALKRKKNYKVELI